MRVIHEKRARAAAKTTRTWMLTAAGGSPRFFEMSVPADEAPDWDPPLESEQFHWADYSPLELYVDGKLTATGDSWTDVAIKAARKLR